MELIRAVDSRLRLSLLDCELARRAEFSTLAEDLAIVLHLQFVEDQLVFASTQVLYLNPIKRKSTDLSKKLIDTVNTVLYYILVLVYRIRF